MLLSNGYVMFFVHTSRVSYVCCDVNEQESGCLNAEVIYNMVLHDELPSARHKWTRTT